METFHQYLQSISQSNERKAISFSRIAMEELQPEHCDEIIDLRPREDYEEDHIATSRNSPALTRTEKYGIIERRENESFIVSLVW